MPEFETKLIGMPCVSAEIIYYLNIVLGFGEMYEVPTRHGPWERHTWEIWSWNGIWRLTKSNKVVLGAGNSEAFIEEHIKSLVGLKVNKIEYEGLAGDLKVTFHNGVVLDILEIDRSKKSHWSIYGPDGQFPPPVSEDEDNEYWAMSDHSKECFSRWSQTLPMKNKPQNCKNCAFYFPLRGVGYFWDFGVCTNVTSNFDGKVVNVGGICDRFSSSLIQKQSSI